MRRFISAFTTPTAKSSALFYFGSFAISGGRYLFHLILLRLLLPSEYGEFLSYWSLLYLLTIPYSAISNIITKYVAEFSGKGNWRATNQLFYYLLEKFTPVTLILGILFVVFARPLATAFKAHPGAFIILGLSVFLSLISTLVRSYLAALQRFVAQIFTGIFETAVMIFLAVLLIINGFGATGAVAAQLLSGILATLTTFYLIRGTFFPRDAGKRIKFDINNYSGYSLIYAIGYLSLISTDVLLVRFFFSGFISGIYSSLSILGRMIFFGLGPFISLVLPIASHRQAAAKRSRSVFLKLGAAMTVFGILATSLFVFYPDIVIRLSSGANYLEGAPYLPFVAVSMFLFSLNLFIISYFMAIGQPQANKFLLAATTAQPLLILLFHNSLSQVVNINLAIEAMLFLALIWRLKKQGI